MPNYGDKKYWEDRYEEQKGKTFEWLEDYSAIKPIITKIGTKKNANILNVGCGNSEFSENMYSDGFTNIYNIDICPNVISFMKERNKNKKGMYYQEMDVRDMKFQSGFFDLVIDKSTIDALLCGNHSFINVTKMTKEISRVLKVGGVYLIISYGKPENRVFHLERKHLGFDVQIYTIKKQEIGQTEKLHYAYVCKKLAKSDENIKNYGEVLKGLEKEEYYEELFEKQKNNIKSKNNINNESKNEEINSVGKNKKVGSNVSSNKTKKDGKIK